MQALSESLKHHESVLGRRGCQCGQGLLEGAGIDDGGGVVARPASPVFLLDGRQ